jgi:hypothetical protein
MWKIFFSKKTFYDTMEEEVIDHKGTGTGIRTKKV